MKNRKEVVNLAVISSLINKSTAMQKLLSLPVNLVQQLHQIEQKAPAEWFCSHDPRGSKLGSGGGTAHLLREAWQQQAPDTPFYQWLKQEPRIMLHAGGQSRRLPAYAPSGKVLTPIPVFRWTKGQRLQQHLLDLQLPLLSVCNTMPGGTTRCSSAVGMCSFARAQNCRPYRR